MHQHFLLTAAARTLSVREVFELSDEEAFNLFRELRWGEGEEVVCPQRGVVEHHWFLPSRRQWRCKASLGLTLSEGLTGVRAFATCCSVWNP